MLARGAMRPALRNGKGKVLDATPPVDLAHLRLPDEGYRAVRLAVAVLAEFNRRVETEEMAQPERALVAVEVDRGVVLRVLAHVEARRQPDDRAALELEQRHLEVGRVDPERRAILRDAVGLERAAERLDATHRAQHGGQDRKRVDADVDERADLVERHRRRMPRLDPAPVHLGEDGPDRPQAAASQLEQHERQIARERAIVPDLYKAET